MVDLGDGQVFSLGGSPNDDTYIIDVNSGDVQVYLHSQVTGKFPISNLSLL